MKLIWSPFATQNAHALASFIAQDKPVAAIKWLEDLFERVELLQVLPEIGRIVPEIGIDSIREVIFGQYRVIYQLAGEQIMILTVRHGKQLLNLNESLR
jgi:toxin ParE1/3/4